MSSLKLNLSIAAASMAMFYGLGFLYGDVDVDDFWGNCLFPLLFFFATVLMFWLANGRTFLGMRYPNLRQLVASVAWAILVQLLFYYLQLGIFYSWRQLRNLRAG